MFKGQSEEGMMIRHTSVNLTVHYLLPFAVLIFMWAIPLPAEKYERGKGPVRIQSRTIDEAIGIAHKGVVKHSFRNTGEFAAIWGWGHSTLMRLHAGWYKGYGYVPDLFLTIGIPEGPWTPDTVNAAGDTISMGPTVSEYNVGTDWGPRAGSYGGLHSGLYTVGDLVGPGSFETVPLMAHSDIQETWPDIDGDGEGDWPGWWATDSAGNQIPGLFVSDRDIFFSINDFDLDDYGIPYAERDQRTTQGYATGIQMDVTGYSYRGGTSEDLIIFNTRLINTSSWDYSGVYIGAYFDADVPEYDGAGIMNHREDWMAYLARETVGDSTYEYHTSYIYDQESSPYSGPGIIAHTGITLLKTPGNEYDGIDNDGDGLIDEGSDGIDNDGDGEIDENDGSETDILGITDWHWFRWENRPGQIEENIQEFEQWKLLSGGSKATLWDHNAGDWGSFRVNTSGNFNDFKSDTLRDGRILSLGSRHIDPDAWFHPDENGILDPHFDDFTIFERQNWDDLDCVFIMSSGPFYLLAGETTNVVIALTFGDDLEDYKRNIRASRLLVEYGYRTHSIEITSPLPGDTLAGTEEVAWNTVSVRGLPLTVSLWVVRESGDSTIIAENIPDDGSYLWDTTSMPDGFYQLLLEVTDGMLINWADLNGYIIINNPGNVPPVVHLLSPAGGDILSGNVTVSWTAEDPDGDDLTINLSYSRDGGNEWMAVGEGLPDTGSSVWVTSDFANSPRGLLSFSANDGEYTVYDTTADVFTVANPRIVLDDSVFVHVTGNGQSPLELHIVDSAALTGHTYELRFHVSGGAGDVTYTVYDWHTGLNVIVNADETFGGEGPQFDGLRLMIESFDEVIPWKWDWTILVGGTSTYDVEFKLFANREPADYEVRFLGEGADTSRVGDKTVPFQIWNISEFPIQKVSLLIIPINGDWSSGDRMIFHEPDGSNMTWDLKFTWDDTLDLPPQVGDVLTLLTGRPYESGEVFFFNTNGVPVGLESGRVQLPLAYSLEQNYPNPWNARTTIRYDLPETNDISLIIYNIMGQEVFRWDENNIPAGYYEKTWNGTNKYQEQVASGIYFYRLIVGDFVKTRKMLLLK